MALDAFIQMRKQEGFRIKEDFENRIKKVEEHINKIFEYSSGLVEYYWFEVRMFRDN